MRRAACGGDYSGVPNLQESAQIGLRAQIAIPFRHHGGHKSVGLAVRGVAFAHVELPETLTHFLLCRCQSDGPFRLDPEEVESGQFMSLQVQTLNDSLIPSVI